MIDFQYKESYNVEDLRKLTKVLRSEDGCPWDKVQTHESIRRDFIEEVYEVIEAINDKDAEHLKEELGDVLEQVLFHAGIEEDAGNFTIDDVADGEVKKLIFRHPNVFGDVKTETAEDVLAGWDDLKMAEKHQETVADTMNGVAKSLPSLWRAEKVQKKAAKVGFDWGDPEGILDKIEEELSELREAVKDGTNIEEELGDLIFSAVNFSRFMKIDPETALTGATNKFIGRFTEMEKLADNSGKSLSDMTAEEMDELWRKVK
jgi:tetrapyrrole methylase family protein/MazG family protein